MNSENLFLPEIVQQSTKETQIFRCILGLDNLNNVRSFGHADIGKNPTAKTLEEMFVRISNLNALGTSTTVKRDSENQVSLTTERFENIIVLKDHGKWNLTYKNRNNEKKNMSTEDPILIPYLVGEMLLKIKYPKKNWNEIKELVKPIHSHFDRRNYSINY
jgi:hypothetical protein